MEIAVVVPAAGAALRMKSIKQLLPYKGNTLLQNALTISIESNATYTVCVLGANAEIIQENGLPEEVFVTLNENWASGLGSSIAHSINYLEEHFPNVEGVLFILADQPFVNTKYLNKLISLASDSNKIIATQYENTVGVPALFPKSYFSDLKKLSGEQGAKKIIKLYESRVVKVNPDFDTIDIDTPEDYKKL